MTNSKSTTGFPTSYRWIAYVTPKLALSLPKGGSKTDFSVFLASPRFLFLTISDRSVTKQIWLGNESDRLGLNVWMLCGKPLSGWLAI